MRKISCTVGPGLVFVMVGLMAVSPVMAQDLPVSLSAQVATAAQTAALATAGTDGTAQAASAPPATVVEYSDAYRTRAKIHKVASLTTLPLFGAEAIAGLKLYNARQDGRPTETLKSAHLVLAGGIGALFAVNSVTGVWNLIESRHDPNHRGRRWLHGLLMLGSEAGFVAAAATAPGDDRFSSESPATHRAIALTSIGAATTGYLIMLLGSH